MKIEKMQKLNNGKYKVIFDNKEKMVTYDDVILKNELLFNRTIDEDLLHQLNIDTTYYDVYHKCIKYITTKLRSEKEMGIYLKKFCLSDSDEVKVIENLKAIHLIDDANYAKAYLSDRLHLSSDGPDKIKNYLYQQDIAESIIEDAFAKMDVEEVRQKLEKIIQKKIANNHRHSNYHLKQKLIQELMTLGYDKGEIVSLFEKHNQVGQDNIMKEINRLYPKLVKKFDGNTLYYQLRQKLMQKGYTSEEIGDAIQQKMESVEPS